MWHIDVSNTCYQRIQNTVAGPKQAYTIMNKPGHWPNE